VAAASELANLLKDTFEKTEAARALISMGPEAEKAVMPFVTYLESQVRQIAVEILARIGTKECIPELQKIQNDRQVGLAARQAIQLIRKREMK
jgi:HEAT repeat protein